MIVEVSFKSFKLEIESNIELWNKADAESKKLYIKNQIQDYIIDNLDDIVDDIVDSIKIV